MKTEIKDIAYIAGGVAILLVSYYLGIFDLNKPELLSVSEAAKAAFEACGPEKGGKGISKETCYSKELEKIAVAGGYEYAFDVLFELQDKDKDARGCHFIAHGIGYGSYDRNPESWQEQINVINQACTYGAVHGTIEKYTSTLPGQRLTREIIPTLCGDSPRADCNHIVGHLILVETRGDIDVALDLCKIFISERQKDFCYTGVFMEFQTANNLINHGLAPLSWLNWPARVEELEQTCRSYEGAAAVACWEEIVHAALAKFGNNAEQIFGFCDSAPIDLAAIRCRRHSIGIMATAKDFDLPAMQGICKIKQEDNPDFEGDCYVQLVSSAMSTLPEFGSKARAFCHGLEEEFKARCLGQVQSIDNLNGHNDEFK
jgi:hypothetical protein